MFTWGKFRQPHNPLMRRRRPVPIRRPGEALTVGPAAEAGAAQVVAESGLLDPTSEPGFVDVPTTQPATDAPEEVSSLVGPMILDGFSLNAALRYLPARSFPIYLDGMRYLREHAAGLRPRYLAIPPDNQTTIPFGAALLYQERVVTGSWLWGLNFVALNNTITEYRVQISDACSQAKLWSYAINATGLRPTGAAGTNLYPVLLDPIQIHGEGQLDIEISSGNLVTPGQCQLLLHFAEPCDLVYSEAEAKLLEKQLPEGAI